VLIGIERGDELALCLSSFFRTWLETYSGGRLRGWLTISINDSIAKFPVPQGIISIDGLAAARRFNDLATRWARVNDVGMTGVITAIHSADNSEEAIVTLRNLLPEIDRAVADAYCWRDLGFSYGFRESHDPTTNLLTKYEVSEPERTDLLRRLVGLNRSRVQGDTTPMASRGGR
jgi:hypothetical protein